MIGIPRLLAVLLPFLMAATLVVAPAKAQDGHAAAAAALAGLNVQPVLIQPSVDHSSKRPRARASLEEFYELDDDAEQNFKRIAALVPGPVASFVLLPGSQTCFYREAGVTRRRLCAAYPTGPPLT
jgi:hypothetical protein